MLCLGQARQIVSGSFASQLAAAFRPSTSLQPNNQQPSTSSVFSLKRLKKTCVDRAKSKSHSRTYKVVFIKETELPTHCSKSSIIMDGIIDIKSSDEEMDIKENLKKILLLSGVSCDDITILTYNSKKLSLPHCAPGFLWNGQQVKAAVGQGKLYVMVIGYKVRYLLFISF